MAFYNILLIAGPFIPFFVRNVPSIGDSAR